MTEPAPLVLRVILLVVLLALGVAQGWIGARGLRGTLPRGRGAGVRTAASMRSNEAFTLANRVAGMPVMLGGLIAAFGGVLQFFLPDTTGTVVVAVIAAAGMVGISVAGGVRGHRAASELPGPEPLAGCGGCMCGGGGCGAATT